MFSLFSLMAICAFSYSTPSAEPGIVLGRHMQNHRSALRAGDSFRTHGGTFDSVYFFKYPTASSHSAQRSGQVCTGFSLLRMP